MSGEQRVDRLFPALTAKERATLVLRAWKEDADEDRLVRSTMPDRQGPEFNRYIDLMNAANGKLGPFVLLLDALAGRIGLRLGWLSTLHLWSLRSFDIASYIWFHTKEPVTESEHTRLAQERRAEMAPADELAELLVERFKGWADEDLEPSAEPVGEPLINDGAWNRVLAEKKKELARLVQEGVLTGRRQGKRLLVNVGVFYDWLDEPTPVRPEWGKDFEVFPDDQAEKVRLLKEERMHARESFRQGPTLFADSTFFENGERREGQGSGRAWGDEIATALTDRLREGITECWSQLRAAELIIATVAEEFGGEDPLAPAVRSVLDGLRQELAGLHGDAQKYTGAFDLPEPDEALIQRLRDAVDLPADGGGLDVTINL